MTEVFLVPGLRTPFAKSGGVYAQKSSMDLSIAVLRAVGPRARPDFLAWGQVIPDPSLSNIARELVFEGGLDPTIPAYSAVMACSSSFMMAIHASGMVGRGGTHLGLVGGVDSMSHFPIGLKYRVAEKLLVSFKKDPAAAAEAFSHLTPEDFDLPVSGWANRQSGRTMGDHMEETAKQMGIAREDQDRRALLSHQGAIAGQRSGFYRDLVVPYEGVDHDTFPREDTSIEKLGKLPPVFDRASGKGTITAGNSSPLTDGAASLWVADAEGLARLGAKPTVKFVDWEVAAVDFRSDGMLMAPARAVPRLLARHRLRVDQVALWEIHEAFASQVLCNVRAIMDPEFRRSKARVDFDLGGEFPWDRVNPNGGSIALGHPFGATGARILSQAAKELEPMPKGSRAVVSVCADGGQGTAGLLERL